MAHKAHLVALAMTEQSRWRALAPSSLHNQVKSITLFVTNAISNENLALSQFSPRVQLSIKVENT
jgi:hypothetical protein